MPDPRYTAGIDWRARMQRARATRDRSRYVEGPDASPYLAAADVMVTDHSSVGFEYLVLDRPLIVFDAPGLVEAARINPEKVALLRSAATVVRDVDELAAAARAELAQPGRLSIERRRVAARDVLRARPAPRPARWRSSASCSPPRCAARSRCGARPTRSRSAEVSRDCRHRTPSPAATLDATVLIATYNRAALLDETLTWLARMRVSPALTWEVDRHRQQLDRRHARRRRAPHRRVPRPPALSLRRTAGPLERAQRGHRAGRGIGARVHGRRRARRRWMARCGRDAAARAGSLARVHRRARAADLGGGSAGVARPDARRSLGHDRHPESRRPPRSSTRKRRKVPLGANMAVAARRVRARSAASGRISDAAADGWCSDRKCRSCCCAPAPRGCAACTCRRCRSTITCRRAV